MGVGDNARHDSDSSIPRTAEEVFLLNGFAMEYFKTTFNSSVPVIPSIGNNVRLSHFEFEGACGLMLSVVLL